MAPRASPELRHTDAERDKEHWECHQHRPDVREKFSEESEDAEDERRLHTDDGKQNADGSADLTAEEKAILDQRLADFRRDPNSGAPAEQLKG